VQSLFAMVAVLPLGWTAHTSKSHEGRVFYFNTETKEKRWSVPTEENAGRPEKRQRTEEDAQVASRKVRTTPKAQEKGDSDVRALHILVKHRGSRNPQSWRSGNKPITRSKEEALVRLAEIRKSLSLQVQGGDAGSLRSCFERWAKAESDCSSARKGGDLGSFRFSRMQRPFSEAAFGLQEGELSGPVDTQSGVHLILRVPLHD